MKKLSISTIMLAVLFLAGTSVVAFGDGNGDGKKKDKGSCPDKDKKSKPEGADKSGCDKDKNNKTEGTDKPNKGNCDQRQDRQAKRIEHGIKKGYLTSDEVSKLENQQKSIAEMEANFKADGKLTKDERKKLQDALNEASKCIWAEKHDTDGNQMPTYRLGKNVFAKDSLTSALANENLSGEEAKKYAADFKKIMSLKHSLATKELSAEDRAKMQTEYNELLNKYFEVRQAATSQESGK